MKPIKMFGLTALAALIGMVSVGVPSAMAEGSTTLCTHDESPCVEGDIITHVHETSVGKGKLKSSLPTIECNVLFLGNASKGGLGNPLVIHGQFTYTNCNNSCTVQQENGPATIEVLKTASELSAVTGEGLVHVSCPFINCNYVGTGLEGHGLGALTSGPNAPNGSVVLTEQSTEKESGSCPEEAFLTITTTPLSATYISASPVTEGSTALCASEQATCSSPITHVHETSVGKGKLKSSLPTIECNVLFLGDALEGGLGNPLVIHGQFTYSSCNNFCSVKEESANATIEVLRLVTELADVIGEGLVHVSCPFISCNYIGTGLEGYGLGPLTSSQANGSVVLTEQNTEKESGSCPEEAFLTITTTPLSATYIST